MRSLTATVNNNLNIFISQRTIDVILIILNTIIKYYAYLINSVS